MLIECPECKQQVSDKAVSCPHCGFPIQKSNNSTPTPKNTNTGKNIKFGRLPNGFGSIKKLSGKRRNPYAVYSPVKGYDLNGKAAGRKAIGYFPNYKEAYECLIEYNKSPFDNNNITFKELFELWYDSRKNDWSKSAQNGYKTSFKHCLALHDRQYKDIKTQTFQETLDSIPYQYGVLNKIVNMWNGMTRYGMQNDLIKNDYSQYVMIKKENNPEHGVPFTEDDLKKLWTLRNDEDAKVLLIMIYTGFRIGELQGYKRNGNMLIGGIKSRAGRDRIVPILPDLMPIIESFDNNGFKARTYRNTNHIDRVLKEANCLYAPTGEKHTSHDCRHTFSWLADKYKMDDFTKHLIMGHSLGPDVEKNTYGHRTEDELIKEMNKIKVIK